MRSLTVVDPGPLTTVQDTGRVGWAHLGVPRAGALDRPAADLANRLVGNDVAAAVLETTLGGVTLTAGVTLTVAVTGAPCEVSVGRRAVSFAEPFVVREGQTLTVGPAVRGVRSYVAVAGGVAVQPVLGSRSTDTLAFVGPPPLRAGDVLPVGTAAALARGTDVGHVRGLPRPALLRVYDGPRVDWFDADVLGTLTSAPYTVTGESNRVGLRLEGERAAPGPGGGAAQRGAGARRGAGAAVGAAAGVPRRPPDHRRLPGGGASWTPPTCGSAPS